MLRLGSRDTSQHVDYTEVYHSVYSSAQTHHRPKGPILLCARVPAVLSFVKREAVKPGIGKESA